MNIKEIIYNIRKRPKMYIADFRLDYLFHYVMGILTCYRNLKDYNEADINFLFINKFDQWVFNWIKENLNKEYTFKFLWYEMIEEATLDEHEALKLFYKICDDFFEIHNPQFDH